MNLYDQLSQSLPVPNDTWTKTDILLYKLIQVQMNSNAEQFPITATINITGLTVIDMTNVEYADIVVLTSNNAAESINAITNTLSNKNIIFRPASGLIVTFNNKSVTVGSNLILYAEQQIPNGTKFGFIELRKRSYPVAGSPVAAIGFFETNFMDEYFS